MWKKELFLFLLKLAGCCALGLAGYAAVPVFYFSVKAINRRFKA